MCQSLFKRICEGTFIQPEKVAVCQKCREECEVTTDCFEDERGRVNFTESMCCGQPVIWENKKDA